MIGNLACVRSGSGKDSYHRNSGLQAQGFSSVHATIEQAIASSAPLFLDSSLDVIRIVDLGCSHGSNTIQALDFVAREITRLREQVGDRKPLEIQAIFSDLAVNDFNTLFALVPHPQGEPYFFSGVPGSFYGRLFPRSSIHFAMTSYALHYLSKIPESITDKNSPAWNRDSMFVSRSSPPAAIEAFAQQASDDLFVFLHSRAQELVTGGILLLMFPIRLSHELNEADFPFQSVWKDLIQEGLVSQESLDTFNFPAYLRSGDEVRSSLGSVDQQFTVIHSENLKFPWLDPKSSSYAATATKYWKAVSKPFIEKHIGNQEVVELMYERMPSKVTVSSPSGELDIVLLVLVKK
ncbi:indole-3-acetate O-methyltransferase 1 isoform X1 [Selaginella moellendorffii]|uniref:indole-3-acetate O-methyltransferase 1 isoform X1 n=1 Tax=Selaginella moellendorffii TaxID=88036 RepID=UPI000D1C7801|nr:indole-3-acetate O-methyltransferase 1 isoform X1 [Selaginella moellendorffii]|eukprot:XP_024527796.1 indole-3-acetate O-methyltransferase 1 isoform X1 [Selaginella moellendorffii]